MIDDKIFSDLVDKTADHLISIYIPTYRANHNQEDQLRYKNALKEAHQQLEKRGMTEEDAKHYLRDAYELLEQPRFWSQLSDGFAAYIGPDFFHYETLPVTFDEFVYVGERFHLSPVLPVLNGNHRFFLLALSQNEVRFFEGNQYSITPVIIKDLVPESMASIFEMSDVKEHLQHHSAGQDGSGNAIYHGQGQGEDDRSEDIKKYLKEINDGLMKMLHDEKPPMIVACVDSLLPLYKEVNDYKYLVDDNVSGNPEQDDPVLLHEKAWEKMKHIFNEEMEEDKKRFQAAMANDRAAASLPDIVSAANYKKVETLFLRKGAHLFGHFDSKNNKTTIHESYELNDRDLLDLAAVQTHLNGGKVYLLSHDELPVPTAEANAIYRFQ
jgi:hypothetical protein